MLLKFSTADLWCCGCTVLLQVCRSSPVAPHHVAGGVYVQ